MASRPPLRTRPGGGRVPAEDVLRAAARAAVAWSARPALERGRTLLEAAADLEERRSVVVEELRGSGFRLSEAVADVDAAVDETVRWAGWTDKVGAFVPRMLDLPAPGSGTVVLVLGGGGEPVRTAARTVLPVLATGGAVLLLPRPGAGRATAQFVAGLGAALPPGLLTDHPDWADPQVAGPLGTAAGAVGAALDLRRAVAPAPPGSAGSDGSDGRDGPDPVEALRDTLVAAGGRVVLTPSPDPTHPGPGLDVLTALTPVLR
ncbi:aldehyde dehydrogenase family protein [Kineococcus gynurae]|uniref:Aldehyde dehydrogenase family protein n=1 Tax=Kineococcus gynurae TaxID=452979 RepID=A0ABV5LRS4_9ACTN